MIDYNNFITALEMRRPLSPFQKLIAEKIFSKILAKAEPKNPELYAQAALIAFEAADIAMHGIVQSILIQEERETLTFEGNGQLFVLSKDGSGSAPSL